MTLQLTVVRTLVLGLVVALYGCAGQAQTNCDATQFRYGLLKSNNDWRLSKALVESEPAQRTMAGRADVAPVTEILVRDGAMWASTYRADFFPVEISEIDGRLWLQGLVFQKLIPGGAVDQPAILVKPYAEADVRFSLSPYEKDCAIESVVLTVDNIQTDNGKKSERWLFTRSR